MTKYSSNKDTLPSDGDVDAWTINRIWLVMKLEGRGYFRQEGLETRVEDSTAPSRNRKGLEGHVRCLDTTLGPLKSGKHEMAMSRFSFENRASGGVDLDWERAALSRRSIRSPSNN